MNIPRSSVIAAFSEQHAERLTGVTKTQLRYWDRTGFFLPSYAEKNRRVAFSRVYSFKDIVSLRVLNVLRNQFGVSLPHLRDVANKLSHLADYKWTSTKLYVLNKKVIWMEPDSKLPQEIASQQYIVPVVLSDIVDATDKQVLKLNDRDDAKVGKIERSRYNNHNAPVISGTRIPVSAIKSFADAGYSSAQILKEYPDLTEQDVSAAISYKHASKAA
jgi:uncharacterized protein (DUF433 family)